MRKKADLVSEPPLLLIIAVITGIFIIIFFYRAEIGEKLSWIIPEISIPNNTQANVNEDIMISSSTQSYALVIFKKEDYWKVLDFRPFIEAKSSSTSDYFYFAAGKDFIDIKANNVPYMASIGNADNFSIGRIYSDGSSWFYYTIHVNYIISPEGILNDEIYLPDNPDPLAIYNCNSEKKKITWTELMLGDSSRMSTMEISVCKSQLKFDYTKLRSVIVK